MHINKILNNFGKNIRNQAILQNKTNKFGLKILSCDYVDISSKGNVLNNNDSSKVNTPSSSSDNSQENNPIPQPQEAKFPTKEEMEERKAYISSKYPDINPVYHSSISILDSVKYSKLLSVFEYCTDCNIAFNMVFESDKVCNRFLDLLKEGMEPTKALSIGKLEDTKYERADLSLKKGYDISLIEDVANLEDDLYAKLNNLSSDTVNKLYQTGMKVSDIAKYSDKFDYDKFINEIKDPQGHKTKVLELQNSAGFKLAAVKKVSSSDNEEIQNSDEVQTVKIITLDENGQITKSTSEIKGKIDENTDGLKIFGGESKSWYYGSDRTTILNHSTSGDDIISQIEIVNNKNNEPEYILYTKDSKELQGAYETIRYELADYPSDMDVLEEIQNGTIQGGKVISSVTSKEGYKSLRENFEFNNSFIKRNYSQILDDEGNIVSYQYEYGIKDENSKQLLSLERSWTKNPDNTTTTVINGKEFKAKFDDIAKTVEITGPEGFYKTIVIKNLIVPYNPEDSFQKSTYKSEEAKQNAVFDFIKTLPCDQLLNIGEYITNIDVSSLLKSAYGRGTLVSGLDLPVTAHELGHAIDFGTIPKYTETMNISDNQELIDIYNDEMNIFNSKYPELVQNISDYFSQNGGSARAGLSEMVAETNMLMTTYGNNNDVLKTRSQYLVRYFPKTISKIAQLMGYNSTSSN